MFAICNQKNPKCGYKKFKSQYYVSRGITILRCCNCKCTTNALFAKLVYSANAITIQVNDSSPFYLLNTQDIIQQEHLFISTKVPRKQTYNNELGTTIDRDHEAKYFFTVRMIFLCTLATYAKDALSLLEAFFLNTGKI